ncbi:hypothetical protein [Thiobacter aerophilum]|uniref:hypothetical protein n=1 Tax=Thiobacter aerophilum TaxID=3121275 RepID=UPI003221FA4C
MKITPSSSHTPVHVEAIHSPAATGIRLTVGDETGSQIHLSIEQARALSLALIRAVNHQERQAPTAAPTGARRKQAQPVRR